MTIFCFNCVQNQNLLLQIQQFNDSSREELEKRYPQVCSECEPKVRIYLDKLASQMPIFISKISTPLEGKVESKTQRSITLMPTIIHSVAIMALVSSVLMWILLFGYYVKRYPVTFNENTEATFILDTAYRQLSRISDYLLFGSSTLAFFGIPVRSNSVLLPANSFSYLVYPLIQSALFLFHRFGLCDTSAFVLLTITYNVKRYLGAFLRRPVIIPMQRMESPTKYSQNKIDLNGSHQETKSTKEEIEQVLQEEGEIEQVASNGEIKIWPQRFFAPVEDTGLESIFANTKITAKRSAWF